MSVRLFPTDDRRPSWLTKAGWQERLWRTLLLEKLNTQGGYLFGLLMALAIAWLVGKGGYDSSVQVLFAAILLPAWVISVFHIRLGLYAMLVLAFFVQSGWRISASLPEETVLDVWLGGLLLGMVYRQIGRRDWRFLQSGLTWLVLLWVGYCFAMVLNPWALSQTAWLYAVRPVAFWMLVYLVVLYSFQKPRHVLLLHRIWISLVVMAAAYGLYQAWFGFTGREWDWILASPERLDLVAAGSSYRVFSVFQDPASYGIMCVSTAVFVFILGWRQGASWRRRGIATVIGLLLVWAGYYSGARTAILLLPVAAVFYLLMNPRRRVLLGLGIPLVLGVLLITLPISNRTVQQFQSQFQLFSGDSYLIRMQNQAWIQPYILEHPIGFGLGATGEIGQRFAPDHILSQFPPDSGYVRIAVETGWLGLALYLLLLGAVLYTGIRGHFQTRSYRMRAWYQAYLGFAFLMILANFPKEPLLMLPGNLMFFISMGVLAGLHRLEKTREPDPAALGNVPPVD